MFGAKKDYEGEGEGSIDVTVIPGASASQVANQLVEEDVIRSADPFLKEVESRGFVIKAGTFKMRKRMSSSAAVDALEDATAAQRLTVAEGHTIKTIKANAIKAGVNEQQLDKAIDKKKPKDYGLDIDAPNLEGYLYPATYDIDPSRPAEALVQDMVNKTKDELNRLAIPHDDAHYYLTLASLVEKEATSDPEVQAKVARVFVNRVGKKSQTGGLLQSDATVAYIHGARQDLTTTKKERESNNPYNTYKHKGWTPGPINSPGEPAVRAAMKPAKGDWQFFVATDPDNGTVKFANNYQEHQKNVEEFRKWLREHRKKNG
nr:endolytic transglycosylase MltG [Brevibacterium paucivorans]